jgi:hypothetical protein
MLCAARRSPPTATLVRGEAERDPSPWQQPWFLATLACLLAAGLALGLFVTSRVRNRRVMHLSAVHADEKVANRDI